MVNPMDGVIAKYTGRPFEYGVDCCQFVGDCVEAMTGRNPTNRYSYETEADALALIARYGDLETLIRANYGEPYDGFKDGDICLVESVDGEQAAGIVYRGRVVVRTKRDLMDLSRGAAKFVWCT